MHTKTDSGQIKFHFWQNQKYGQSAKTDKYENAMHGKYTITYIDS